MADASALVVGVVRLLVLLLLKMLLLLLLLLLLLGRLGAGQADLVPQRLELRLALREQEIDRCRVGRDVGLEFSADLGPYVVLGGGG